MTVANAKAPTRWAREYETIYILRPNVLSADAEKVGARVAEVLERLGGHLTQVDHWGRRMLAYKINKQSRGIFVYLKYVAFNDAVAELERNLRLMDEVIRYQTILLQDRIDPSTIEVDPEAVVFEPIEDDEVPFVEQDLASRLGMNRPEPRAAEGAKAEAAEGEDAKAEAAEGEDAKAEVAEGEDAKAEAAEGEGAKAEVAEGEGAKAEVAEGEGAKAEAAEGEGAKAEAAEATETAATASDDDSTEKEA